MAGKKGMRQVDPAIEAAIVAQIETGMSCCKIAKKYGISNRTVEAIKIRKAVRKGILKPIIAQNIQQQFIEALSRQGCNVDYLAKKVKELMEATAAVIGPDGKPIGGEDKDGNPNYVRKEWQAISKGLSEANKILGAYAPVQSEIEMTGAFINVTDKLITIMMREVPVARREAVACEIETIRKEIE